MGEQEERVEHVQSGLERTVYAGQCGVGAQDALATVPRIQQHARLSVRILKRLLLPLSVVPTVPHLWQMHWVNGHGGVFLPCLHRGCQCLDNMCVFVWEGNGED